MGKFSQTGNDKIIIYSDSIKTYNLDGGIDEGIGEIEIDGTFKGLELHDVGGSTTKEFVVLVDRHTDDPDDGQVVGNFLEAYYFTGVRLANIDNRWPINISNTISLSNWPAPAWHKHFTIGDVDDDGELEVLQLLRMAPYYKEYRAGYPGIRVEVIHLGN